MAHSAKVKATKTKNARLQVRVDSHSLDMIERAANLSHQSVSDFVLDQVLAAANKVITEQEKITLPEADWQLFFDALMNPPKPNRALKSAFKRFRDRQK